MLAAMQGDKLVGTGQRCCAPATSADRVSLQQGEKTSSQWLQSPSAVPCGQLWPRLQDVFNLRYKEVAEPLIQQSKPRWVFETRVLSFEIGDVPPTITGVKAFKESSSPNHVSSLLR